MEDHLNTCFLNIQSTAWLLNRRLIWKTEIPKVHIMSIAADSGGGVWIYHLKHTPRWFWWKAGVWITVRLKIYLGDDIYKEVSHFAHYCCCYLVVVFLIWNITLFSDAPKKKIDIGKYDLFWQNLLEFLLLCVAKTSAWF